MKETEPPGDLPTDLHQIFERTGPSCAAAETNIGVVHACHAPNRNIAGFANAPVWCPPAVLNMTENTLRVSIEQV